MTTLTARHPLFDTLSDTLLESGTWQRWRDLDPRLALHDSLDDALTAWRRDRDASAYLTVAALAALGSSRGGNDNDATLAVIVLLQDGLVRLASDLRDVCELDDVLAALWEEVRRSAPNLGHRAPRFLLQRTKARILSPTHGFADRGTMVPLDSIGDLQLLADGGYSDPGSDADLGHQRRPSQALKNLAIPVEEPSAELTDLLNWAHGTGVVERADVDLVVELVTVSRQADGREAAYRVLGQRHGVATRTIRRRRNAVVDRLRSATRDYLAEI